MNAEDAGIRNAGWLRHTGIQARAFERQISDPAGRFRDPASLARQRAKHDVPTKLNEVLTPVFCLARQKSVALGEVRLLQKSSR